LEVIGVLNGHHHELVAVVIIELLPIGAPGSVITAAIRDLPFSSGTGEGGDIDLESSGLVRGIGEPFAVRREDRLDFNGRRIQERNQFPVAVEVYIVNCRVALFCNT